MLSKACLGRTAVKIKIVEAPNDHPSRCWDVGHCVTLKARDKSAQAVFSVDYRREALKDWPSSAQPQEMPPAALGTLGRRCDPGGMRAVWLPWDVT